MMRLSIEVSSNELCHTRWIECGRTAKSFGVLEAQMPPLALRLPL